MAFGGVVVVKRPSGGIEARAGGVIPHYVGPATLLRHSLPAHTSLPLIFADLIRASLGKTVSEQLGGAAWAKEEAQKNMGYLDRFFAPDRTQKPAVDVRRAVTEK